MINPFVVLFLIAGTLAVVGGLQIRSPVWSTRVAGVGLISLSFLVGLSTMLGEGWAFPYSARAVCTAIGRELVDEKSPRQSIGNFLTAHFSGTRSIVCSNNVTVSIPYSFDD
jgi:hypothetical protein